DLAGNQQVGKQQYQADDRPGQFGQQQGIESGAEQLEENQYGQTAQQHWGFSSTRVKTRGPAWPRFSAGPASRRGSAGGCASTGQPATVHSAYRCYATIRHNWL